MNACTAWRENGSGYLVFAGGFVSSTSLWNGSTDFQTRCETATKLEKEIDRGRNAKMFSSEDFFFLFPFSFIFLFCFPSICAFLRLANEFLTVP